MNKFIKTLVIIFTMTLLLCGAYYLGTTQTEQSKIPYGYTYTHSKDFTEQYIDTDSIESVVMTKDGFEIYTNDGNVFFFDCAK